MITIARRTLHGAVMAIVLNTVVTSPALAQARPATIPVVVAESMALRLSGMLSSPEFFSGSLPTGWPQAVVPKNATVLGGGIQGGLDMFMMRTAVFQFASPAEGETSLRATLTAAGYTRLPPEEFGGPVSLGPLGEEQSTRFCKDSSFVAFGQPSPSREPNVFSVIAMDGVAGRENCKPSPARMMGSDEPRVVLPRLLPPRGTTYVSSGSGWSGDEGRTSGILVTTLQADSILYHYREQLVVGGWRADGRPAAGDGVAAQRFNFTNNGEVWLGTLIVFGRGDRSTIQLLYARDNTRAR